MAPTEAEIHEAKAVLGARENLVRRLHPSVFSFFGYYGPGISLLVWDVLLAVMLFWKPLNELHTADWAGGPDGIAPMLPILLWAGGATLIGLATTRRFSGAFRGAYWAAVVIGIVMGAIMVFGSKAGEFAPWFTFTYGLFIAIIAVFAAEVYRRAFTYYITDMRVIMRYKLFSTKETDQRFERIEDWKISRSFLWRLAGVGTVRAYTGTEDGKYDPNRSFDSPDECLFGVKNPEGVKRTLVDLMIDRDRWRIGGGTASATASSATAAASVQSSTQPAPAPPVTEYYKPAPAPVRNYERVPPAQAYDEAAEAPEAGEWPSAGGSRAPTGAPVGPVDPAAGAYPAPASEPQPRRMFPEPEGGQTEPVLVEKREMRFDEGGTGGASGAPRRARPAQPPEDDELKPSKL
jgi:hypothetical protein